MSIFTPIAIVVLLLLALGPKSVGAFEDLGYSIYCGFCKQSIDALVQDFGGLATYGQQQVKEGVDSYLKSATAGTLTSSIISSARFQIILGSFGSIFFLAAFYLIFNLVGRAMSFEPPLLVSIGGAVLIMIALSLAFDKTQTPFAGWVALAKNPQPFTSDIANAISPVPLNLTNVIKP